MLPLDELLANWATRYYEAGLKKLLPKARGTKRPLGPWKHLQTHEPTLDEIKARFAVADGADGICAVLNGTGLAVVDVDGSREHGRRLLADAGVQIPDRYPRVITGSGHDHFWFRTNRRIGRHIRLLASGTAADTKAAIDLLGEGVVLLPPSVHPETGVAYQWGDQFFDTEKLASLPPLFYNLIEESTRQPLPAPVDGAILKGERERILIKILGAARRQGAQEAGLRALAEATNARCQPALGSRDLDRLARSIARYEPDTLDIPALLASVETVTPKPTPAPVLSFVTPVELMADRETHLDYVLAPYLIADALTDVTGAAKIGKTRLRNYLIRCSLRGESCLGYPPSAPTKVVLLTEEPIPSLMEGLAAAGLTDTSDLVVLTRYAARAATWADTGAAADAQATTIGARVLMVDTAPGMARLEGDSENSSGHALAALRSIQETQTPGLAKVLFRHTRKSGGDLVEAGRGSSAFAGEADVLVGLTKPKGAGPTVRRLEAIGRFEAIPPALTVERVLVDCSTQAPPTDPPLPESNSAPELIESYRIVSNSATAADPNAGSVSGRVARALPESPFEAKTASELAESMEIPVRSVRHGLDELGSQVGRRGTGTRGDPLKFFIPANPDLKGLPEWNNPDNDTKGGTHMAIQASERGPPAPDTTVHDETGTVESPGQD